MDSPLQRKNTSKWSKVQKEPKAVVGETIFSRPAPPQTLTRSISMEDLTALQDATPPTTSLYDDAVTPEKKYHNNPLQHSINSSLSSVPGGTNSLFNTPGRQQASSNGEPVAKDGSVTVFGFPAGSLNVVLAHFKTFGPLLKYEEGRGNWVDVTFASKWAAQKALSKNGTMLPGTTIMVGVIPSSCSSSSNDTTGTDQNASFLTSPKKKTLASNTFSQSSTASTNNASIYAQTALNGQQQPSFPIRLFKFIMGW